MKSGLLSRRDAKVAKAAAKDDSEIRTWGLGLGSWDFGLGEC